MQWTCCRPSKVWSLYSIGCSFYLRHLVATTLRWNRYWPWNPSQTSIYRSCSFFKKSDLCTQTVTCSIYCACTSFSVNDPYINRSVNRADRCYQPPVRCTAFSSCRVEQHLTLVLIWANNQLKASGPKQPVASAQVGVKITHLLCSRCILRSESLISSCESVHPTAWSHLCCSRHVIFTPSGLHFQRKAVKTANYLRETERAGEHSGGL